VRREAAAAAERVKELAEQRRRQRAELQRLRQLEREQAEENLHFHAVLKTVPLVKAGTNRAALPKSVLENLEAQKVFERVRGPLTFEVSLQVEGVGEVRTFCGVDDFTQEEGSVGIPPQVALSLTSMTGKKMDVDELTGKMVDVRFVELAHFDKISVAFQPRGKGFHTENQQVVNLDIKTVLQRTLRDMITLSEGDVVPIRHEEKTYELLVKSIEPESAVVIINTDVDVELLPSEDVEEAEKRAKEREKWLDSRRERIRSIRLPEEPSADAKENIVIRLRLPNGKNSTRRFSSDATLSQVLDWAVTVLPDPPADITLHKEKNAEFELVRSAMPGTGVATADHFTMAQAHQRLQELAFPRRESLFVCWVYEDGEDDSLFDSEGNRERNSEEKQSLTFSSAIEESEMELDQELQSEQLRKAMQESLEDSMITEHGDGIDKIAMFHTLVANGVDKVEAVQAAQNFSPQLIELQNMGFHDFSRSIALLKRYQGRMERVVNLLAGGN